MAITGSHHLQVLRGLTSNNSLLSCSKDGSVVDLFSNDDGTGRQVWNFQPVPNYSDLYYITVSNGVTGPNQLLSCAEDGSYVDLYDHDDNSGRQRWSLALVPNSSICSYYNIRVSSGVGNGRVWLSCGTDNSVNLWTQDDGSGRQRWQLQ